MRKVILYVATSLDGYIARENGAVDWLDQFNSGVDYGYKLFCESVDTVLMGYGTYVKSLEFGDKAFIPGLTYYVFTRKHHKQKSPSAGFVNSKPANFLQSIKEHPGKDIWLMGGGKLIQSFVNENLIDTYRIFIMPLLLGNGIPLIPNNTMPLNLHLEGENTFSNGVVELQYAKIPS